LPVVRSASAHELDWIGRQLHDECRCRERSESNSVDSSGPTISAFPFLHAFCLQGSLPISQANENKKHYGKAFLF